MTTPRVRTEGPPGQARRRRPSPPEVPAEYSLTTEFRTKYQDKSVDFEVYGRRTHRDAYIRLIDECGSMDAGTVGHAGTKRAIVTWHLKAGEEYDRDWLSEQAASIKQRLAERWSA